MRSVPKILLFIAFFSLSLGFSIGSWQIQANDAHKPLLIAAAGDIACDPNPVSFINPSQVKSPDCQM
jgi:cytochrome oxidase assembly protein ShyY1